MTIRDWPEDERPREKLLARGASALSDAELLALFFGSGRGGQTAVDLGRELLTQHGSLKALLELEPSALAAHAGLGAAKACRVHAALELGRRYLASELQRPDALAHPAACAVTGNYGAFFPRAQRCAQCRSSSHHWSERCSGSNGGD